MEEIRFKRGLSENLPTQRDKNTIYYTTDTNKLYIGDDNAIGNSNIADITDLQNVLDGKSNSGHTHTTLGNENNSIVIDNESITITQNNRFTKPLTINDEIVLTSHNTDKMLFYYEDITENKKINDLNTWSGTNITELSTNNVKEFYAGWSTMEVTSGSLITTLSLDEGQYIFHLDGFFREGATGENKNISRFKIEILDDEKIYASTLIKPLTSIDKETYANNVTEANVDFINGLYHNMIDFLITKTTQITIKISCEFTSIKSWGIITNPKLVKLSHEVQRQVVYNNEVDAWNVTKEGLYTDMTVGRPNTASVDGDTSYTLLCGKNADTQMCVGNVTGKLWTRSSKKGAWDEIAKKKDIPTFRVEGTSLYITI